MTNRSDDEPVVVPVRHPARWVATALVLLLAVAVGRSAVANPNFQWSVVAGYVFDQRILSGLRTTLLLTAVSMSIAFALGLALAIMRLSPSPFLRSASWAYIWTFRGVPLLVQLLFWFNLSALFPRLSIGIPFGPSLYSVDANQIITTWVAAVLGLALCEAAYMAEIIRAGFVSVHYGQIEAAEALGMRRSQLLRRIMIPQALRVIVPPTGNETISMLKYSAIVSVIALPELLYSGQLIYSQTFEVIPVLIVVSLWYVVVVAALTIVQSQIEKRLSAGFEGARSRLSPQPESMLSRIFVWKTVSRS